MMSSFGIVIADVIPLYYCYYLLLGDSDKEDWRMPHGKRPTAVEINSRI